MDDGDEDLTKYKGPTPTSNWLVPNKILLGAYPSDSEEHIARLQAILSVEISPQTETNYLIPYKDDVKILFSKQFTSENALPVFLDFPIEDGDISTDEELHTFTDDLLKRVENGEKIYIHCFGGRGRTGTIAAVILGKMFKINAEDALNKVNLYYNTRPTARGRKAPETPAQFEQVARMLQNL